jgi:peptidyl-prolyl cis-trans isomerase A (cyclophilin A)
MRKHIFTSILVMLIVLAGTLLQGCGYKRQAVIQTTRGTIKIELYEERAPITTANFIDLVEDDFYDGLIFHRIIDDFMIQTGDPTGTGSGGSNETINLEIHPELRHIDGAISMARSANPNSASSQFFICDGAQSHLDDSYAVFGKTVEGIHVVRAIAAEATGANDRPINDVKIVRITIE